MKYILLFLNAFKDVKLVLVFSLLFLMAQNVNAQQCDRVQPVYGENSSEILFGVDFVNVNTGITVGAAGRIISTTDGGNNWIIRKSGTRENLLDLHMLTAQLAYAVGSNGVFLKTLDGGETWAKIPNFTANTLTSVHFTHPDTGFVAGHNGTIFKTTNGGASWTSVSSGVSPTANLIDMVFPSSSVGYIVSNLNLLLKTTNAGLTWSPVGPSNTSYRFTTIAALSNNNIVMGRDETNQLVSSNNGGTTLSSEILNIVGARVYKMHLLTPTLGYGVGNNRIYRRNQGSWTVISTGQGTLNDVKFPTNSTGYAVGYGTIFKTTNSGTTWTRQNPDVDNYFNSVFFLDRNTGYLAGNNGNLHKTTNGGQTLTTATLPTTDLIKSVHFINATTGLAATNNAIFRTVNGGTSWTSFTIPGTYLTTTSDFVFTSPATGYIGFKSGNTGRILKTTDGGLNWSVLSQNFSNSPEDIAFIAPDTGFVTLSSGFTTNIFRTYDAGATWTSVFTDPTYPVKSIAFANSTTGMAVGGSNFGPARAWRTTDGGTTWLPYTIPANLTEQAWRKVTRISENKLIVTGSGGLILKSADAGLTWTKLDQPTFYNLDQVVVADDTTNFIISNSTGLLVKHTLTSGLTTPVITQNGAFLSSSSSYQNQWYLNGNPITGATGQSLWALQNGTYTVQVTNGGCTSQMSAAVAVVLPVGLPELSPEKGIAIYPNPAQDILTIELNSQLGWEKIRIYDLQGRVIKTINPQDKLLFEIELTDLAAGVYILSAQTGNQVVHRRFIRN